jgi:hypothetical protein
LNHARLAASVAVCLKRLSLFYQYSRFNSFAAARKQKAAVEACGVVQDAFNHVRRHLEAG